MFSKIFGDLSAWNADAVTNMGEMFFQNPQPTYAPGDVSGWNANNMQNKGYPMFNDGKSYAGENQWNDGSGNQHVADGSAFAADLFHDGDHNDSAFNLGPHHPRPGRPPAQPKAELKLPEAASGPPARRSAREPKPTSTTHKRRIKLDPRSEDEKLAHLQSLMSKYSGKAVDPHDKILPQPSLPHYSQSQAQQEHHQAQQNQQHVSDQDDDSDDNGKQNEGRSKRKAPSGDGSKQNKKKKEV